MLWFFGLKFYNDDRHKCEHIINTVGGPHDELGLGNIHPDAILVDIDDLTSKGKEIVEKAIDSDRSEFTVYREKHLPDDFSYVDYSNLSVDHGYYIIHDRGRYYQLWTIFSESHTGA